MSSGKADLVSHANTKKHITALNTIVDGQKKINEAFPADKNLSSKKTEIRMAFFIAEHNLPFLASDHLTKVFQNCFMDCDSAKNITLGRTKAKGIIKNVIGKAQHKNVCELLKNNVFSLCVDESTDVSNKKSLCLVVRVCIDFKIYDLFFGLLQVDKCDAQNLYKLIINEFIKNNINYKQNMVGFAADGAAVMTGKNHSVAKLLKDDNSNLLIIKCTCHSLALCSSYACLKLPSTVETLTRNIFNYLSNSPKRCSQFNDIQTLLELKPKKMLHPSQTRWLSLEAVVVRILDLFECLKIYFSFACNVDKIDTSIVIYENLNEQNLIYLSFLKYILGVLNNINRIFQSESTEIHNLHMQMERLFKTVINNFIKQDVIKSVEIDLIDYNNPINFLKNDQVYLGIYAKDIISKTKLNHFELNEIIENCVNFYVELCRQIKNRFDFNSNLKCLKIINPNNFINGDYSNNSVFEILKEFPNFVEETEKQDLDSEFRELNFLNFNEIFENKEIDLYNFWKTISEIKRGSSFSAFPVLSKFIQNIMTLPHSSANVERIFSQINLNKTKIRNSLENESIEGILYCKDYLKLNNSNCYEIVIKPELLNMLNSNIYL